MQCPQCQATIGLAEMSKHRCPSCASKIYFSPKWQWLRGIACGAVVILVTYRWYPFDGSLTYHLLWCVASLLMFVFLLLGSIYVLPPEIELVPGDGPIRLDL
jgi:DNA-directed RNA polymerase subunit RPC12/RpoP